MTDEEWNRDPRTIAMRTRFNEALEAISALVASRVLAEQSKQRSARAKVAWTPLKAKEAVQ